MNLVFTLYQSAKVKKGEVEAMPWAEWVSLLGEVDIRPADPERAEDTKDGPAVLFGEVKGIRRKENVVAVHALSADLDDTPQEGVDRLRGLVYGSAYLVHSTHKHGLPGRPLPRLRFVFPLARAVTPEEFPKVRAGFDLLTCGLSDPAARDIARLNYLPSSWSAEVETVAEHHLGELLDPDDLIRRSEQVQEPTPETLKVRRLLKKLKTPEAANVLAGRPFAWSGERHSTILALTMHIAVAAKRTAPSEDVVAEVFQGSIKAMQRLDPNGPGLDEVLTAYRGAVEKSGKQIEEREAVATQSQLRGSDPYSAEQLEQIREAVGVPNLDHVWVLQKDTSYYLLDGDGTYRGPYTQSEARPAMAEVLCRAPVRLWEATRNGAKRRSVVEIVEDHGRVASEVIADLVIQSSQYDEQTNTIREAVRPIRMDIEPRFVPEVDQFLTVFGGTQADKLKDWIACVPDCSKLLCALYLSGAPGTGKTSLAHGLARLWHEGPPTEFFRLLGDFNADLCNCPVVLADEHVPLYWKGGSVTKMIRSVISIDSRPLARKYLPTTTLNGAIRLILASNDDFLLKSTEAMGASDLEAVSERFLYLEAPVEARRFLEGIPSEQKERWISSQIAEHALWLFENREVKRAKRFWVSGSISAFHRLLVQSSDINAQVNQWLVYYLMNPQPIDVKNDGLVRISDGRLLVNDQAVIDGWSTYFPNSKLEPTVGKIGAALRAISGKERERLRFKGQRIRYRVIDLESLFAWSDASNIGDRETIEITLGTREPDEVEVTDDIASVRGSGKTAKQKLQEIKNRKEDEYDDPGLVDEQGDRVPF